MTKLNWKKPYIYNLHGIEINSHVEVFEWESTCGNFRIYKENSDKTKFFINIKEIVELYDINDEMFQEDLWVLSGNKEGYATLKKAKDACNFEVIQ